MPRQTTNFRLKITRKLEDMAILVQLMDTEKEEEIDNETFPMADVAESVRGHVGLYGLGQFLQDRVSDTNTGPDKLEGMREVFEMLKKGEWEKERVSGGFTVSPQVEALARIKGVTIPQIQAALKSKTKEQREKILAHKSVTELAEQIKKEREGQAEVALDDLENAA
jgi:hypothetical protein